MGKKPIVSVTYENERISIKNSLPYLKCVLRLSCVVHGLIYGPSIKSGTRNIPEHAGTFRNILEHPGTSRNTKK